jgi:hypothetical protein
MSYLLVALRDAYASGKFRGTADLKAFLEGHAIPSETHVC